MLDNLSQEIFRNSPTFRAQMSSAFTDVALERWKVAEATVAAANALIEAGIATSEQLIAKKYAATEASFLRKALAIQGVYLDAMDQPSSMLSKDVADAAAKEGITKLINQMLGSPRTTWAWTVADWMTNQATAVVEIATHLDSMFAAMVAAPSATMQQIQVAAADLPVSRSPMP